MAKLNAPLLSLGASGKLGDALVYSKWRGIDLARVYVVPANPQTAAQQTQRGYLADATDEWKTVGSEALTGDDRAAWNRLAQVFGRMSGFNAFTRIFVNELVAGGTPPGHFYDGEAGTTTAASATITIEGEGLTSENVTLQLGNTLTNFSVTDTQAASSGTATFSSLNTTFPAGTRVYWFVEVGTPGSDYMRSGIYSFITT